MESRKGKTTYIRVYICMYVRIYKMPTNWTVPVGAGQMGGELKLCQGIKSMVDGPPTKAVMILPHCPQLLSQGPWRWILATATSCSSHRAVESMEKDTRREEEFLTVNHDP